MIKKISLLTALLCLHMVNTSAQTTLLNQDFTASQGNFTISNVSLDPALTEVWTQTSSYGMKASGYANYTDFAAESWLISPQIDLTMYTDAKCSFYQALNYFSSVATAKDEATLWISTDKANWTQLTGYTYPTTMSWTFVETGDIDLSDYSGQKIYLGFKYTSTATKAGTWEIKWVKVTATEGTYPTVNTIGSLKQLTSGSVAMLKLDKSNPAHITYVNPASASGTTNSQMAFIRDDSGAVSLVDFLNDDPGWHTAQNGALIGSVVGQYLVVNGMPQFIPVEASTAEKILCLDNYTVESPREVTLNNLLTDTYKADYVKLTDVTLSRSGSAYYAKEGTASLLVENTYGLSSVTMPVNVTGNRYEIEGILTTNSASQPVLSVLHITTTAMLLEMYDEEDNSGNITYFKGQELNVNIVREIPAGSWNTIVLPFSLPDAEDLIGDIQLAEFTGYDSQNNTLEFTTVYDIEAGHPYLIKPKENIYSIYANGVAMTDELTTVTKGDIDMVPIYDAKSLLKNDNTVLFLANDNMLYNPTEDLELCSFRAYFRSANAHNGAQITIDGQPTGITAIIIGSDENGNYFDIAGRPVAKKPNKGIYVRKGNKLIIK